MGALAHVLRDLPGFDDPNLLVGLDHFDDAGVYRLTDSLAVVTTLDFFPPLVDDPYQFGQIAAANSLSDIYAMGARPIVVLNIVGYPDTELPIEWLGGILRGGAERVKTAGAVVAGGHSVRDAEIKYGLSATGVVHPDELFTNTGARPGDLLVLTKPIGSGVLTSAAKAGKIPDTDLSEAIDVMVDLNAGAADAAAAVGARGVTDITGFGLIGHAFELAEGSDVSVELRAGDVPLLAQTLELARRGVLTRAHESNLEHLGDRFESDGVEDALIGVLADAQTSGGLLIAVSAERVDELCASLAHTAARSAAVVGRVVEKHERRVVLS